MGSGVGAAEWESGGKNPIPAAGAGMGGLNNYSFVIVQTTADFGVV
jgi:hypothetical protein